MSKWKPRPPHRRTTVIVDAIGFSLSGEDVCTLRNMLEIPGECTCNEPDRIVELTVPHARETLARLETATASVTCLDLDRCSNSRLMLTLRDKLRRLLEAAKREERGNKAGEN